MCSVLIPYFVHPRFACQTSKNPKISSSLHGAIGTSRMTWCNPFGHWSTQNASFSQNDQNAPSQPWVDRKSNKVKILSKYHFSSYPSFLDIYAWTCSMFLCLCLCLHMLVWLDLCSFMLLCLHPHA